MALPSRSPTAGHTPSHQLQRDTPTRPLHLTSAELQKILPRSPSPSRTVKCELLSPSSSFTNPSNMDSSFGNNPCPPFHPTEVIHQLQASDGQMIHPEIYGRIYKGFFMADNDWTCYRRNYFSLNCSYTLRPAIPSSNIHLLLHLGSSPQVVGFSLSIAAVVDGRDGKSTELIQHTLKRDKGSQVKPARIQLAPRPPPAAGMYGGDGGLGGSRSLYDPGFGQNPNAPVTEATFERIQFKNATANNGKRRAAQQYYHLLIELFADIGAQYTGERWVKIASRMSVPMVVRGRSPGHYQSERRGSNASTGPGSSGGAGNGGSYPPSGSSRTPGDINMSGTPSLVSGSNSSSSYDSRMHHYEGHETRYQLPSVSDYTTTKVKHEYGSGVGTGYVLPSIASTQESLGQHCGHWEATVDSKGYFPPALLHQSERRDGNASPSPGGSGGAGSGGSYPPGGSSRTLGDFNISGTSSLVPGSSFNNNEETNPQLMGQEQSTEAVVLGKVRLASANAAFTGSVDLLQHTQHDPSSTTESIPNSSGAILETFLPEHAVTASLTRFSTESCISSSTCSADETDWDEDSIVEFASDLMKCQSLTTSSSTNQMGLVPRRLTPAQRQLIDRLMEEFWMVWNKRLGAGEQHCDSPDSSASPEISSTGPSGPNWLRPEGSKRSRENNDRSDDENGRTFKRVGKTSSFSDPNRISLRFACPYRKHNPRKYCV
jgi:meiosis-specific transcription factor NDT80